MVAGADHEKAYIAGDSLRHVVAGMLSTIDFVPSEVHPGNMLYIAEKVIHHIRMVDSETPSRGEATQPEEGPFEGQDVGYSMRDARP